MTTQDNGVIRIGKKGLKKFAFGDGAPFEVDVVVVFQEWICIDDRFREHEDKDDRAIATADMPAYHAAAVEFVQRAAANPSSGATPQITTAEALDFLARLREQYDGLVDFFRPKSREERASPDTSGAGLQFSEEPA